MAKELKAKTSLCILYNQYLLLKQGIIKPQLSRYLNKNHERNSLIDYSNNKGYLKILQQAQMHQTLVVITKNLFQIL